MWVWLVKQRDCRCGYKFGTNSSHELPGTDSHSDVICRNSFPFCWVFWPDKRTLGHVKSYST